VLARSGTTEVTPLDQGAVADVRLAGVLAIVNANASGARRVRDLLDELRRGARAAGIPVTEHVTSSPDELGRVLEEAEGRRVVLVGGDGSVQAAANATTNLPELALLAAGRANNIARALGIPLDPAESVAVALTASCRPLDLLRVEGPTRTLRCVEGLSAGFQARARSTYDGVNSGDLVAGVRSLLHALQDHRPAHLALEVDGRPVYEGDVAQVFVSNLPFFGFGFRVDPLADPADGRFEAIVVTADTRRELVRMLLAARSGAHIGRPGVEVVRGSRATLRGHLALAGDGTLLGAGDVSVTVEPSALHVASAGRS